MKTGKTSFLTNRRRFLASGIAGSFWGLGSFGKTNSNVAADQSELKEPGSSSSEPLDQFRICLNAGSLSGYQMTLEEELETAWKSGYRSIEIWINRLQNYLDRGLSLDDLKKRLDDRGLKIESAIGFATWIVDDPDERRKGQDQMRREMEYLARLGAPFIAAPAAGPWNQRIEGISVCADRYRQILEIGEETGVRPLLEVWGTSPTLSRLSDALAIAAETGRSDAALLLDVYHLYRGGNSFESLNLVSGTATPIFHMNDYPAEPERERLTDGDRVFPGDGIAPIRDVLTTLKKNGFNGALSLELFNDRYCKTMKPIELARTGYEKIQNILDSLS